MCRVKQLYFATGNLMYRRNTLSDTNRSLLILFVCKVGCGEIKPVGKTRELIDIDKPIIVKVCKRQPQVSI